MFPAWSAAEFAVFFGSSNSPGYGTTASPKKIAEFRTQSQREFGEVRLYMLTRIYSGGKARQVSMRLRYFFILLILIVLMVLLVPVYGQEELRGDWLRFGLQGEAFGPIYGASSVLEAREGIHRSRYGVDKAMDEDPATAWVEGVAGPGEGESYWLGLDHYPEALGFINGYAKNRSLFDKNYRVRSLEVQTFAAVNLSGFAGQWELFYDALPISEVQRIEVQDSIAPQRVLLPFDRPEMISRMEEFQRSEALQTLDFPQAREMGLKGDEEIGKSFVYILRLTIETTYPGSIWEDTCIAELWPDYGAVTEIDLRGEDQYIDITDELGRDIPVFYDFDYVLTLIDWSEEQRWALVIKEPAYPDSGRVSSAYAIIHLPTGRELTAEILGPDSESKLPYAFSYRDGRVFVEWEHIETGAVGSKPCVLY